MRGVFFFLNLYASVQRVSDIEKADIMNAYYFSTIGTRKLAAQLPKFQIEFDVINNRTISRSRQE